MQIATTMKIKIFQDKANIKCGVGIALDKDHFPLECFFFETNPDKFLGLLSAVEARTAFVNGKSGIRFASDLDWEDEVDGLTLDESHVYVFTHDFGDKVIEMGFFLKVLNLFLSKFTEVNANGSAFDQDMLTEISTRLSKVFGVT